MEDGMMFEGPNHITDLFQNESSEVLDSLWISNSSSASFHEENIDPNTVKRGFDHYEQGDEDCEKVFRPPEKKRRLAAEQVEFLERSFEAENKLEPERKLQLAKELNLQPRQVAIWFQNRRARHKTKQLEKDYDCLKSSYDQLKLDFDCLQTHNDSLRQEIQMLTGKLLEREKGKQDSLPCEDPEKESESNAPKPNPIPKLAQNGTKSAKEEAKSDSNSCLFLEPADSSNVFENQSDFSQDEEDNLSMNVLRFSKTEYEWCIDPNSSEGGLGYPIEDQAFWLWA